MPKQTVLGEDADIYKPREKMTEKEKLRNMPLKKRFTYLWEYYRIHALVAIAVIALAAYIIHNIITPDVKTQFYAAIINNAMDEQETDNFKNDFSKYLQLNPKTENVVYNTNIYFGSEYEYSANMQSVLATLVAAKEIDVIIAPESKFKTLVKNSYFSKLSEQLPTDIYSSLTDKFYISNTTDDKEKTAYGIYLTDAKYYKDMKNPSDPYVLGIMINYQHKENTLEFIRYLFKQK